MNDTVATRLLNDLAAPAITGAKYARLITGVPPVEIPAIAGRSVTFKVTDAGSGDMLIEITAARAEPEHWDFDGRYGEYLVWETSDGRHVSRRADEFYAALTGGSQENGMMIRW